MSDQIPSRSACSVRLAVMAVAVGAVMSGAMVATPAGAAPYPPLPPTAPVGGGGIPAVAPDALPVVPGSQNGLAVPAVQPYRGGIAIDPSSFPVQAQTGSGPETASYDATVPFALVGLGVTAAAAAGVVVQRRRRV